MRIPKYIQETKYHEEAVDITSELSGDLDSIINYLVELKAKYSTSDLTLDLYTVDSYYNTEIMAKLRISTPETPEEKEKRLQEWVQEQKKIQASKKEAMLREEEEERALYNKLKEKYG